MPTIKSINTIPSFPLQWKLNTRKTLPPFSRAFFFFLQKKMGKKLFIFVVVSLFLFKTEGRVLKLLSVDDGKKMVLGSNSGVRLEYYNVRIVRVQKSSLGQAIGVEKLNLSVEYEYDNAQIVAVEKSGPSPGEGHK